MHIVRYVVWCGDVRVWYWRRRTDAVNGNEITYLLAVMWMTRIYGKWVLLVVLYYCHPAKLWNYSPAELFGCLMSTWDLDLNVDVELGNLGDRFEWEILTWLVNENPPGIQSQASLMSSGHKIVLSFINSERHEESHTVERNELLINSK